MEDTVITQNLNTNFYTYQKFQQKQLFIGIKHEKKLWQLFKFLKLFPSFSPFHSFIYGHNKTSTQANDEQEFV